jgi:hypothetical protein
MRPAGDERREFQRLELDPSIPGALGPASVEVTEIGVLGARVHHTDPLDGQRLDLHFIWANESISLSCDVVRTIQRPDGGSADSGLRFVSAHGDSGDHLRMMLGDLVTLEMQRRRNREPEEIDDLLVDGDRTVRGTEAGFLCYRFENGRWARRAVFLPEQPRIGFTVARNHDQDEMHRLCKVYEVSDEEGRRLIRMFAELSVSGALRIPPRS